MELTIFSIVWIMAVLVNLVVIPLGIYFFIKKKDIINFKFIFLFFGILLYIHIIDMMTTVGCYVSQKSMDGELNPYAKFVIDKTGFWGFPLTLVLNSFFLFFVIVGVYSIFIIQFPISMVKLKDKKHKIQVFKRIDDFVYENRYQIGYIVFVGMMIFYILSYIPIPINNYLVCEL
jgi:hypothetical protein